MQVAILSGIYAKESADLARSYPVNLTPVTENSTGEGSGISKGYLRLIPGAVTTATFEGADRGGTLWQGRHIRALGSRLVEVSAAGAITAIDDLAGSDPVSFATGFDRLGIAAGGSLYYLTNTGLAKVTDGDLGAVLSVAWQDGYWITTDGEYIVVTELNDPTAVDPLKYGSAEADPDPLVGVLSLRGELYAIGGSTIEVFGNRAVEGFPFIRNRGAQIPKGAVGSHAFAPFVETFAFVGSCRNEGPCVYLAGSAQAIRISPRLLDEELSSLSAADLAAVEVESRLAMGEQQLLVHLPDRTWVYHWIPSQQLDFPVWSVLEGVSGRHYTLAYGAWWVGGAGKVGRLDDDALTILDQPYGYRFDTQLLYNEGRGALVHELELATLAGRSDGTVFVSFSDDGRTWSVERPARYGAVGNRAARPTWRRLGRFANWRTFRFRGQAAGPVGFVRLEAQLEALGV